MIITTKSTVQSIIELADTDLFESLGNIILYSKKLLNSDKVDFTTNKETLISKIENLQAKIINIKPKE